MIMNYAVLWITKDSSYWGHFEYQLLFRLEKSLKVKIMIFMIPWQSADLAVIWENYSW